MLGSRYALKREPSGAAGLEVQKAERAESKALRAEF